ncbi:CzcE family metal-binding protein [Pseudoduganella aquatica]|uniref:CzcE family metal-binding protein n=1 Tax=Pseudoduganella aquatica TaxID=2660641 RepID=UPI001E4B5285|nr:CzcE family metal-binding protein [Pseudoduganella aquatica]
MQTIKTKIAAVIAAALMPFAAMAHQPGMQANPALGSAVVAPAATRTIIVSPATKAINVDKGEVVTIEVEGKSFTWQFDTLRDSDSFALAAIAPEGISTHGVWVYVAPNPLYTN